MLPKMDSILNPRDIFLWPDGYWCYREEFHQLPRLAYPYRLVRMGNAEWHALRGGYPAGQAARGGQSTIRAQPSMPLAHRH
jgi:hypothetical protein